MTQIEGTKIQVTPQELKGRSDRTKIAKLFNSKDLTDAQIRDYAQRLAGDVPLKQANKPGVFYAELPDGRTINLRSVSSSQDETGARWTIDIIRDASLNQLTGQKPGINFELKFK